MISRCPRYLQAHVGSIEHTFWPSEEHCRLRTVVLAWTTCPVADARQHLLIDNDKIYFLSSWGEGGGSSTFLAKQTAMLQARARITYNKVTLAEGQSWVRTIHRRLLEHIVEELSVRNKEHNPHTREAKGVVHDDNSTDWFHANS